jgi:queuosine biosynthesis protein QueD
MRKEEMNVSELRIHVDGASRGNPGPAAIAGVLTSGQGHELERFSEFIGEATNNEAEYRALIEALNRARQYRPAHVTVVSDSELMVRQMKGLYNVRSPSLAPLHRKAQELVAILGSVEFVHVRREENALADSLANRALDLALRTPKRVSGKMTVTVREKFDSAHRLTEYEGTCARLHGHTYVVEVSVVGAQLRENGLLIDFGELKGIVRQVLSVLDHAYLNEIPPFTEISPTGENIAMWIAEQVNKALPAGVTVSAVRVFESENAWVTFEP